jgi:4-azaleucine resistance transporter AzlC
VTTATITETSLRDGIRAGLPFVLPTTALGISFGVLAEPVMGKVATIVASLIVYAGGAQFAALSVLTAGGTATAAISAGLLMNARFIPMGFALAPSLEGSRLRRALQGQAVIDASWAIANRGDGSFDRMKLFGATIPQWFAWQGGTIAGVFAGAAVADPEALGLDAVFPAFYLVLLFEEVRRRRPLAAALAGTAITLALMPFAPPGVPVIAATAAALIGLRK